MASLRPVLPLVMVAVLIAVEERISGPSCVASGRGGEGASHPDDLKVMMVADLLLLGSDASYADTFFRDSFTSKFFRKSFERLKPDMLVVLGDISAKGWALTGSKWLTVLRQFHTILGPVVERESIALRNPMNVAAEKVSEPTMRTEGAKNFDWRDNHMESGSGPVLLLHFPLYRKKRNIIGDTKVDLGIYHHMAEGLARHDDSNFKDMGPYELDQTLPVNATEYIFQALKPRIVFSAHTHSFCDHTHSDGTREITVPAMTWAARQKPGFVFVNFRQNKAVSVSHCSFASERHVILTYIIFFMLFVPVLVVIRCSNLVT
ncbi:uncharacterized protein LOC135593009 isoform X2 [Musa acuminata AAA Group]|uniref:uncharacterized protein LOC135593009 isoform X2 n=1 Tax=Musa acuminata AAA Group TaxID=214697 RepID=UPI0031E17531